MLICIAEDRPSERVAVKLLIASLLAHCPDVPIDLSYPPMDETFVGWLQGKTQIQLRSSANAGHSWNIKPYLLLALLDEGHSEVWWLDSDVLVTADFRTLAKSMSADTLVACEEALYGAYNDNGMRTEAWGLPVGRRLPFSLNSAVLRITQQHRPLLQRWCELLEHPVYRQAQQQSWTQRPTHLTGDQDVLAALVSSAEFADIPLHILHRGSGIIQYFGFSAYTLHERWLTMRYGLPPFVHCQGWKPWSERAKFRSGSGFKQWLQALYIQLSPYMAKARCHQPQLDETVDWLQPGSHIVVWGQRAGLGQPALTGLPLAVAFDALRVLKHLASCLGVRRLLAKVSGTIKHD